MEKKIKSSFGKNLFKIRKEKSLSQEKLSNLTGISQRMIAYYEKQAINPPLDKIEIIAKAINVNIADLIETKESSKIQDEISQINTKTLKRIKQILELSPEDRHVVYSLVDSLLEKDKTKKKEKQLVESIK
ncbi:MAG TPA: helix-turn-helix transcriptional regulator [Candidatus Lokiarchaeia archaeon]